MIEELEFVFSFRSPFAWIAARHVLPQVHPDVHVRWTPFMPLPEFPNFGGQMPIGKVRHNAHDILRLCKEYGIEVGRPPIDEDDWHPAHTAVLHADRLGRGPDYARALFDVRWVEGRPASSREAIADAARTVQLDPDACVADAFDPERQRELRDLVKRNYDEREIFGVPMFLLPTGEVFWGHDRMEWALRYGYVPAA